MRRGAEEGGAGQSVEGEVGRGGRRGRTVSGALTESSAPVKSEKLALMTPD